MRFADCHPDRKHEARGLCVECYLKQRDFSKYNKSIKYTNALNARKGTRHGRAVFMLNLAKQRAKRDALPFAMVLEDIVIPDKCPILGIPIELGVVGLRHPGLPSLDRIIPSLGYVTHNVWVISWRANRMKQDSTLSEFRAIVSALEHRERVYFRARSHSWFTSRSALS